MRRPITWLDVFTSTPLTGNQLAVVHDADGIDDATMLAFARETRFSETTFVQTATDPHADYRNRIWTTRGELPFAGHPSLGTAVAVAHARGVEQATYVQQTHAGLQPVEVRLHRETARASMLQEPPQFAAELPFAEIMAAAGLEEPDRHPDLPAQAVSTGVWHVMAPVATREALDRAVPDAGALAPLLEAHDAIVLYLAAVEPDTGIARARSFFLGVDGVIEDAATGSAAGPLLAYLHERAGTQSLSIRQGDEIGRPSRLDCTWADDRPRVAGDAVIVADGHLSL